MRSSASKDEMTRREFLKGLRSKKDRRVIIDQDKCTGCGLCVVGCSSRALSFARDGQGDLYQLLFQSDLCDGCCQCERSCPENCLRLEVEPEGKTSMEQARPVFKDEICRCSECGVPLFPRAMAKSLEAKMAATGKRHRSMNLCPSCGIKSQFGILSRPGTAGEKGR